jgi:Uma2 family endonuclease
MLEVLLQGEAVIPRWVRDHRTYRRWAYTDAYPERGSVAYLGGRVWVDMSMERDLHNLLKTEIAVTLVLAARKKQLGRYWSDNMLYSNPSARLSTEPDGMFAGWETLRAGRLKLIGGEGKDGVELIGTPDMVLEVVSPSSVQKDTVELPRLYWRAGIAEYWVVDPRESPVHLEIMRRGAQGYRRVRADRGWLKSQVFGAAFRLIKSTDPLGAATYRLRMR